MGLSAIRRLTFRNRTGRTIWPDHEVMAPLMHRSKQPHPRFEPERRRFSIPCLRRVFKSPPRIPRLGATPPPRQSCDDRLLSFPPAGGIRPGVHVGSAKGAAPTLFPVSAAVGGANRENGADHGARPQREPDVKRRPHTACGRSARERARERRHNPASPDYSWPRGARRRWRDRNGEA